jgi:hypothetical protein
MMYRFVSMRRAYDFEHLLVSLGVPASALFAERFGWYVKTDTRCLDHAARLAPFIYGRGGAQ